MKVNYVIVRGPLGCGKSTVAEALAKKLNAEYVPIDRIVDDPTLITREKEEGYISQNNFFQANEIAVARVKPHLTRGKVVVFDGNFYWKSVLQDLQERLKSYKGMVFTLKAPLEVCINRDSGRSKTHGKDAAEAVYKKSTSFEYGTAIDTTNQTPEETVEEILKILRK